MEHEYWTNRLLAAYGLSAQLRVSEMCESLFGGLQITKPFLPGAVFCHGFRAIDFCLSLFPWAKFRQHKAAVKMHTLLDLHGNIPSFIRITDGKTSDVNILDEFLPETGSFYVMDRGYIDFARLFVFTLCSAFFVVRTKENILLERRYSQPVDKSTGVRSDHTVILTSFESASVYPDAF